MKQIRLYLSSSDFRSQLALVIGITIMFLNIPSLDYGIAQNFLDTNPYEIKERIINRYLFFPSVALSVLGLLSQVFFRDRKIGFEKRLRNFKVALAVGVLAGFISNRGLYYLARREYFPLMLNLQREIVIESIKQNISQGTINAQNLPAHMINAKTRISRVEEAKLNLRNACEVLDMECIEIEGSKRWTSRLMSIYESWGVNIELK